MLDVSEYTDYTGMDKKPADFDSFWEKVIKETREYKSEYQLIEKSFDVQFANCFELTFKVIDGSIIYAKVVLPKNEKKHPIMFMFHGYQGQSKDWSEAFKFVAGGIGVVMMDVRGQAGKSSDRSVHNNNTVKGHLVRGLLEGPEHLLFVKIYQDLIFMIENVCAFDFVDENNIYTYGESQGGALAIVAAALSSKVKKVFATYPFLSDFKKVLEEGQVSEPYDELFRYFKFSDPMHQTEEQILQTLGYIDVKNFADRVNVPVIMVCGLKDDICLPSTQYAIYNNLKTMDKQMILFPEYGHEAMNVKYLDLVFNWAVGSNIN